VTAVKAVGLATASRVVAAGDGVCRREAGRIEGVAARSLRHGLAPDWSLSSECSSAENSSPSTDRTSNTTPKRAVFGFTDFANHRIRALLYAGEPNWALLNSLTPT